MIWLLIGCAALLLLLWLMRSFSRAPVADVKRLLQWVAALAGASLALLLILTGRGGLALFAFSLLGPLVWDRWLGPFLNRRGTSAPGQGSGERPRRAPGGMTREEAYAVLGLKPGASEADIRAAHRRMMASAHPDRGGSDWIAARLNQARDVLLG